MIDGQVLASDGSSREFLPANRKDYTLDELKEVVGGYIEIISLPDDFLMVLNEEGKLKGLPFNEQASQLIPPTDYIVGDVLICKSKRIE